MPKKKRGANRAQSLEVSVTETTTHTGNYAKRRTTLTAAMNLPAVSVRRANSLATMAFFSSGLLTATTPVTPLMISGLNENLSRKLAKGEPESQSRERLQFLFPGGCYKDKSLTIT